MMGVFGFILLIYANKMKVRLDYGIQPRSLLRLRCVVLRHSPEKLTKEVSLVNASVS